MDNLNNAAPDLKADRPSFRRRLYDGLPPKGTSLRDQIRMLIFSDNSPGQIALGAAIGIFLACSPFLGTHTLAALALALLFRASRPAAFLGTLVNNPVTMTFIYLLEIKLGSYVLGYSFILPGSIWKDLVDLFSLGRKAFLSIMTGFTILGLLSSITAYLATLGAVLFIRKRRAQKREA
jgi:uncharacterized protein (DUF2062 family)